MKNMKIEALIKQADEMEEKFGHNSVEYKKFNEEHRNAWRWTRAYIISRDKGFDEIVYDDCIFDQDVESFIEWGRKLGIGWFVFATGFSGAFETLDCFVQHGARVGKFVVKEYTETRFGGDETVRLPGMRINL